MRIADKAFLSAIDEKVETLKKTILENTDVPTFSGTAYYVSPCGDDANDGRSPETPVASLERIESLPLKEGDAVLFLRGGLWRGEIHATKVPGVTYSAYGAGRKPRLYGSQKNYAVASEWKPTDIENVWQYRFPLPQDIGHIICDGGKVHAKKKCLGHYGFCGRVDELQADLEFYHEPETGILYFYSDKGNPAERFFEIEMNRKSAGIYARVKNLHIDNLCIMYVGVHGISSGSNEGLHVTNCEFGFIGGCIQTTCDGHDTRYGNAVEIYGACKDYLVDHCYIHDVYDAGVTHQRKGDFDGDLLMEDVTYSNNLFERCIYSIEYFCDQKNGDNDLMRHIRFSHNICRYAGGFGWQRPNRVARHIQGGWLGCKRKYPAEDFVVEDNVFDRSIDTLLSVSSVKKEHLPVMKGNTYIQYAGKNFGINDVPYDHYEPFDEHIETYIRDYRSEPDAVIAVVPEYDGMCD